MLVYEGRVAWFHMWPWLMLAMLVFLSACGGGAATFLSAPTPAEATTTPIAIFAGNLAGPAQTMPLAIYPGFERNLQLAIVLALVLLGVAFLVLLIVKGWLRQRVEAP